MATNGKNHTKHIADWDDARYAIVPPRAAFDPRLMGSHLRVLVYVGRVNTERGFCIVPHGDAAQKLDLARQTISDSLNDLVRWRYLEKRGQAAARASHCQYRVLVDDPAVVSSVPDTTGGCQLQPTPVSRGGDTRVSGRRQSPIYNERARVQTIDHSPPRTARRGRGAALGAPAVATGVKVLAGTEQWRAWIAHDRSHNPKNARTAERHDSWVWPTEWPPGMAPAATAEGAR